MKLNTPLAVDYKGVYDADGTMIIGASTRTRATALAEIVRRVNLHDQLVEAISAARQQLAAGEVIDADQVLAAVLAKVEGR